ncbi:MAG: (d)CMP kinase [Armatimonas sp.]
MKVAIDGPAGAGKSTIARMLAGALGFTYIDSGAMYRCVALASRERGIAPDDSESLGRLAEGLEITFAPAENGQSVALDGADVTQAIRTPDISALASRVSVHPQVRSAMVALQRAMGARVDCVMEGRDIGSVVFPDAEKKVFLTASPAERARRRWEDLKARGECDLTLDEVLVDLTERDRRDAERETSPLVRAEGAIEVITDGLTPAELIQKLVEWVRTP